MLLNVCLLCIELRRQCLLPRTTSLAFHRGSVSINLGHDDDQCWLF